ncbi:MAG: hypothetical protein HOH77_03655 [Candidatus Latescibacteria bacterium]|nr:hypothetical protein [Candidatus Latescibacterota bacterium]
MDDIMMTAGMDNLNIITCGVLPPNPAEITDSRRMTEFLQEAKEAYDVVIVDAPPVLQATDATVLGTKVDGVLLVYKIGNVSRSALRRAKLQLDNVGVATLGVVINGLRADVSEDFKDLRYYSYYTYGTHSEDESGPALVRFYNRTKRQMEQSWKQTREQAAPYIQMIKERLPSGLTTDGEAASEEELEPDITSKVLNISFWVFITGFLVAGLLWQTGYLLPGRNIAPSPKIEQRNESTEQPTEEATQEPTQPNTEQPAAPNAAPEQKDEKTPAKEPKSSQNTTPHTTPNKTQATGVSEKVATAPSFEPSIHKPVKKLPQRTIRQTARRASQTNTGPKYALHVSSHSIVSSAKREAKRLKAQGYTVTIVETNIPQKGIFHRILIGDYATKANAKKALGDVKASLNVGFVQIRPLPAKHLNLARSNNSSVPQTR